MKARRVVLDTNVLVSSILLPDSIPGRVITHCVERDVLLASVETLDELDEVLARRKFDPYVSPAIRQAFFFLIKRRSEEVQIIREIRACRDPKDDKFLELAVNGRADFVITGDNDLLTLDPFHGVRIVRPADYLAS